MWRSLQVRFAGFPTHLLCNEVVQTMAEFTNCSDCHLEKLYITTPNPEFFTFGRSPSSVGETSGKAATGDAKCDSIVGDITRVSEVPIPKEGLAPGTSIKLPVWVHGHRKPGRFKREVLFYYMPAENTSLLRWDHVPLFIVRFHPKFVVAIRHKVAVESLLSIKAISIGRLRAQATRAETAPRELYDMIFTHCCEIIMECFSNCIQPTVTHLTSL